MRYVVGFMFSMKERSVLLIKKRRPEWQAGLLNGIGGRIDPGETPTQAMVREFREECGIVTTESQWEPYAEMESGDASIYFFSSKGDITLAESLTDETVYSVAYERILKHRFLVPNLIWLVPMAKLTQFNGAKYSGLICEGPGS